MKFSKLKISSLYLKQMPDTTARVTRTTRANRRPRVAQPHPAPTPRCETSLPGQQTGPRVSPLRDSPAPPGESPCYTQPNKLRVRSGLTSSTRCVAPLHPAPTPQLFTCCNAIVAVTLNRRRTNSVRLYFQHCNLING